MNELTADYVIVGAGTAGCVLAARLSEDPAVSVLLVEAGAKDRHPFIHVPAGFMRLLEHPSITWGSKTLPHADTDRRELIFPRGRGLGGSSSINGLLYVRPFPEDIDSWAAAGATGWDFASCLPYFSRSETWQDGRDSRRGDRGPIQVTRVGNPPQVCHTVMQAAQGAGYEFLDDPNSETRGPAVFYYQQTRHGRRRSSAARGYLVPALARSNLRVLTGMDVSRVQLEQGRATGVEVLRADGATVRIKASREVLVAAGVVGSPALLERSGIGDADVLANAGIPCEVRLPGVGRNLQDHYVARVCFRLKGIATANERSSGFALLKEIARYVTSGQGLLTYSAAIVGLYGQSKYAQSPDIQFVIAPGSFRSGRIGELETEPGISVGCWQMRPESRGEVHIASADPRAQPVIDPRYLSTERDRLTLVEGLRMARDLFVEPGLRDYVVEETVPGAASKTDADLLAYARANGGTVYHGAGTCRMGMDDGCVVDAQLRVHGVAGLRVIDASVMPTVTSTNTNATVLMLAERAAEMILQPPQPQQPLAASARRQTIAA
ncbi:MAG: GMC family oxidoreductase N-terminal domain-containing protein [Pseudomonadota bacterium]